MINVAVIVALRSSGYDLQALASLAGIHFSLPEEMGESIKARDVSSTFLHNTRALFTPSLPSTLSLESPEFETRRD